MGVGSNSPPSNLAPVAEEGPSAGALAAVEGPSEAAPPAGTEIAAVSSPVLVVAPPPLPEPFFAPLLFMFVGSLHC